MSKNTSNQLNCDDLSGQYNIAIGALEGIVSGKRAALLRMERLRDVLAKESALFEKIAIDGSVHSLWKTKKKREIDADISMIDGVINGIKDDLRAIDLITMHLNTGDTSMFFGSSSWINEQCLSCSGAL